MNNQREKNLTKDFKLHDNFVDRTEHISRFKAIYNKITTEPNECFFMMYYGIAGIGKSALCNKFIKEFEKLDGFDKNKEINKNNKLNNFYAKINLEGNNFIRAEDFLFELRCVIESNAEKYNRVKFEFPIFDTCYSMFWEKKYPHIALLNKTNKTSIGGIMQEIASTLIDRVTMGMGGGLITEIAKIGIEKIKTNKFFDKNKTKKFIKNFSKLNIQKMEIYLPQALAIDIANILKENGKQLLIFVDTYEAIYGKLNNHVNIIKSKEKDSFFRRFVEHIIKLTSNVSFFVFGREKIYWEEIDKNWAKIIETHLIGKLSDNDARKFLTNANIPTNLIDCIIKKADGYPRYLDQSVDIYHNRVDDGENVTENDFLSVYQNIIDQFLKYSNNNDLLKTLAVQRKWNKELFEFIIKYKKIPVTIDYFYSLKKYSFISESGEFLSMHSVMREHIISYLLENENKQTVDLINKLIEYHSQSSENNVSEHQFHKDEIIYLQQLLDRLNTLNV